MHSNTQTKSIHNQISPPQHNTLHNGQDTTCCTGRVAGLERHTQSHTHPSQHTHTQTRTAPQPTWFWNGQFRWWKLISAGLFWLFWRILIVSMVLRNKFLSDPNADTDRGSKNKKPFLGWTTSEPTENAPYGGRNSAQLKPVVRVFARGLHCKVSK